MLNSDEYSVPKNLFLKITAKHRQQKYLPAMRDPVLLQITVDHCRQIACGTVHSIHFSMNNNTFSEANLYCL
jgi:hypothetical protein